MALLEIRDLSAGYGGEPVLQNIDLSIGPGEILCIVGESGSGKSTLVKAVTGDPELEILGGEIRFLDKPAAGKGIARAAGIMGHGIGLIPQNPAGSFNPIRPFDRQMKEMFRSHGMPMDMDKIASAFHSVGLQDHGRILRSRPYEMSGGMNQRIAIAAAMIFSPKLLLCDEATSALDVTTSQMVIDELLNIRETSGTAICMVTHNLGIAKHMADTVAIMYRGRIVEAGYCQEVLSRPEHEYTRKLVENAPRMEEER